ncbi:MAG: LysR family transcriptional regulator [Deltaproteobacteria bacterium]|jgi:molybdate transport system regulatory protein|nr:LysR family transcriptional regulator [Deltaproteobacteria bacterium]
MKLAYKLWLDSNGKAFGDGPYELLKRVKKTNSLRQAAFQMSMSYSKAWRLIRTLEQRLGFPLLERKVGGHSGGGSRVTPQARTLMQKYGRFRKDVKEALERIYQRHFAHSQGVKMGKEEKKK